MTTIRKTLAATAAAVAIFTTNAATALDRSVYVQNDGDCPIWSVRMSHIDRRHYGPDLLGDYVIPAGAGEWLRPVNDQGYCRFDLLITYANGDEVQLWDVNLCEALTVQADNSGYTHIGF